MTKKHPAVAALKEIKKLVDSVLAEHERKAQEKKAQEKKAEKKMGKKDKKAKSKDES